MFGSGGLDNDVSRATLTASCAALVAQVTKKSDLALDGRLVVTVQATGGRLLRGSMIAIGANPIPWAQPDWPSRLTSAPRNRSTRVGPRPGWSSNPASASTSRFLLDDGVHGPNGDSMTEQATTTRALVLAGGGVAGIAWELGVLLGLRDGAPTLSPAVVDADVIVGTSAGSTVAAQIADGTDLQQLFDRQLQPTSSEIEVDVDAEALMAGFAAAAEGASSAIEVRRRIGDLALSTSTVDESVRLAAIRGRLLDERWPDRTLLIPAVDATTGEVVIFDRTSGVSLVEAVAASCAVPGVWPPVTIDGRRYTDGGTRSGTNADLAGPADRILVITPTLAGAQSALDHLDEEIQQLGEDKVMVVHADEASIAAFGNNPLSPATREPAASAGREVGRAAAASVAAFWGTGHPDQRYARA